MVVVGCFVFSLGAICGCDLHAHMTYAYTDILRLWGFFLDVNS